MAFSTSENILIIRFSSLGDILLTTPVVRSLKNAFPHLNIDFLLKDQYADAYKYNIFLRKTILWNNKLDGQKFIDELKHGKYDVVIDLQNNLRSGKLRRKLAPVIYSFNKPTLKKLMLVNFKWNMYKEIVPIPELYAKSIPSLKLDSKSLDLFIPSSIVSNIDGGKPVVGICPGARHYTKRWPQNYYIELGNKLSENGYKIALFGGREDLPLASAVSKEIPDSIDLSNEDLLLQTAADMKKCSVIICNDSGLMHTAIAVKVPVVSIFGSTVKEFGFAPYRGDNLIIENNSLSCRPCSHIGLNECPKGHLKCLVDITPNYVFNKIISLLQVK